MSLEVEAEVLSVGGDMIWIRAEDSRKMNGERIELPS